MSNIIKINSTPSLVRLFALGLGPSSHLLFYRAPDISSGVDS